jgi:hypothetical protein
MFGRKRELAEPNVPKDWKGSEWWRSWPAPASVVRGESRYRDGLTEVCGGDRDFYLLPVEARLAVEPSNPHDPNAIRVEVDGRLVGYIAREVAAQLSPRLQQAGCWFFKVAGLVRGRFHEQYTPGVHLWLDRLITPGPVIQIGEPYLVEKWPPKPDEGRPRA